MKLSDPDFLGVIKNTPLVSIDLIVQDSAGRILLGWRKNDPAKGTWFVPGGRIRKEESLDTAFLRITGSELGKEYSRDRAEFFGIFENRYAANVFSVPGIDTYYINLVYRIFPEQTFTRFPEDQHEKYVWYSRREALEDPDVHPYVLPYFG